MSAFAVLRRAQFRRIFLARSFSTLGDNVAPIAAAFAVLDATNSAVALGVVLAARLVPLAALSLFAGAWADRLPRRPIMVASDLIRMFTQGGFALLLLLPVPPIWAIVALQAVNGSATAFFQPAASGLVQEAVPASERQSANALLSGTNSISSIAGPAIAAVLVALAGNAWALGVNALTFGLSAIFLASVVVPPRVLEPRSGLIREIGDGIREVISRRWIGIEILSFSVFQLFALAAYGVLGPLVSQREYEGATTWALVTGLAGVGAILGDLFAIRWRPQRPLVASNLIMVGSLPLLVGLALVAPLAVLLGAGFLWGFVMSVSNTLWFTTLQRHVPPNRMARVASLDWMGSIILRPVGVALLPLVAATTGTAVVLVAVAIVTAVGVVAVAAVPSVARVRADEDPPAE